MPDKGTKKKITRVEGGDTSSASTPRETKPFVASDESKAKSKRLRLFAILSWIVAIALEIGAIVLLRKMPIQTTWLIILIAADLVFVIIGSLMWQKSNRLNPASEKEPIKFFVQNQLGAIIAAIAFLPLIILIFTNKNMSKKQKGLVGTVGVIALLIAGYIGVDFNPPSQEQYATQTEQVESLTGTDNVYWTKSGTRYHLYSDCYHINTNKTEEIFTGSVAQARELKNISQLCNTCEERAQKENTLPAQDNSQNSQVQEEKQE